MNTDRSPINGTTQQRTLVQLIAPGPGGVRDYLECLGNRWQETGLDSHVITLSEDAARELPLAARLRRLIDAERRPCSLLLHFSGYGFQRRGLCSWLAREIEAARRELGSDLRVVTMFHELFASGPPWRSAFWLSGAQASIAGRVAGASDLLWTNTEQHAHWLRARVGATVPVEVRPVFSTIGEPATVTAAHRRDSRLVVFGSESTRRRALTRLPRHAAALRCAGILEVIEVGSGASYAWASKALKHRFAGRLDTASLRALLDSAAFGLIDYPPHCLGKSTVFAAYAVHGCVVLNTADAARIADGLESGVHYFSLGARDPIPPNADAREVLGNAARNWYAAHTLSLQAAAFARHCDATPQIETGHG